MAINTKHPAVTVLPTAGRSVTVTTSETTLLTIDKLPSDAMVAVQVKNTGAAAMTDFQLYVRVSEYADWQEIELTDTAYVLDYTSGMTSLAGSASAIVRIDATALEAVKVTAKCGTSTTVSVDGRKA